MSLSRDGLPYKLAEAMAKACPDGADDFRFEIEDVKALSPQSSEKEIQAALYAMQAAGLVAIQDVVNATYIRLKQGLFELMDEPAMGWSTRDDGAHLAVLTIEGEGATVPDLHKQTGWPLRRFNPALQWLVDRLPQQFVRSPVHPKYKYYYILGEPSVMFRLKEIIQQPDSNLELV